MLIYSEIHKTLEYEDDISSILWVFDGVLKQIVLLVYHKINLLSKMGLCIHYISISQLKYKTLRLKVVFPFYSF